MLKILLVEDDNAFRSALKKILETKYQVIEAQDGKIARDLLSMSDVNLILSDIQMPYFSGFDLLEWSQKYKPTPFILMTGFSHILDREKAKELGATDFLVKPFKELELFEKIFRILGEKKEVQIGISQAPLDLDKEFCKLPIEDFIGDKETEYEIYIRISATKYIKIVHKGGILTEDKIKTFREKKVTHVFIRQEEFSKLVGFTVLVSRAVSSSGKVDKEKKMRFMKYTGEMIMQQAYVAGADEGLFKNAKDFLLTSMEVLTKDEETFTLLNLLSNHTDYLYSHSLGVSMFSVMIAKQLGWQSPQTLFKLSFAGLFHDIGKKEIPVELLQKPRSTLTQKERSLFESHSTRGREILQSLKTAPTEVIQVAYEHHEDVLGQGFPQGISKPKIHPFSLIVSVADVFCDYTIRGPQNPEPQSAVAALQMMKTFKLGSLDTKAFEALSRVVVL
ncbi:MAG TPA: HD domain-containing phosphohydrolase [Pseudobdellovibrionaceae bacterium]|jgi:putative nucleotidyltransferase with HDIG domain